MKTFTVLIGALCLISSAYAQGFLQQYNPGHGNPYRHLIPQQNPTQNDGSRHRFNPSAQQRQFTKQIFQYQPNPNLDLPEHLNNPINTNLQPLPINDPAANNVRFPTNGNNNFQVSNGNPNPLLQHHTQTNFIPNFVQQTHNPYNQERTHNPASLAFLQQQLLPTVAKQSKFNNDQDFHAQNFIILRNHLAQQAPSNVPINSHQSQQTNADYPTFPKYQALPHFQPLPEFRSVHPPTTQALPIVPSQQLPNVPNIYTQNSPINGQFQAFPTSGQQSSPVFTASSQFTPNNVKAAQEEEARQKLILKHQAFVQKQLEKQQAKIKQQHEEFLRKQEALKQQSGAPSTNSQTQSHPMYANQLTDTRSRAIQQSEIRLFDKALQKYNSEHPTRQTTANSISTTPRSGEQSNDGFSHLLEAQRKDLYSQLKQETDSTRTIKSTVSKPKSTKPLDRDELLKQLKQALAETPASILGNKTFDAQDIVLPNGQRVQIIRTSDPNLIANSKVLPDDIAAALSKSSSNPITKSQDPQEALSSVAPVRSKDLILPNGHKVEIVRAPDPNTIGGLTNLPSDISSLYSQSIANEARILSSDGPPSIEELAKRGLIPEGYEIVQQPAPGSKTATTTKPTPKKKPTFVYLEEQSDGSFKVQGVKPSGEKETKTSGAEIDSILERIKNGELKLPPSVSKVQFDSQTPEKNQKSNKISDLRHEASTTSALVQGTSTTSSPIPSRSTTSPYHQYSKLSRSQSSPYSTNVTPPLRNSGQVAAASSNYKTYPSSTEHNFISSTPSVPTSTQTSSQDYSGQLINILKDNGFFAMAKYIRQSDLDSILNETGPYTLFIPTDKAFKNLLVQLGGPERAEEKFKSNPRLLSGLLLHHVIPGSFEISSLQDEMTGVSLAGTQLRVNQYTLQDLEWNDVLITTINGAVVVPEKQDIKVPQGIAHGIDHVMFPLPVGDLLQTLQADREGRFSNFLKILYTSGTHDVLENKGAKTFTVFAPVDKAFNNMTPDQLQKLTNEKEEAEKFVMRHIMPSTLFSAGMRFYQIKDSLLSGSTITLQKTQPGRVKVGESQMITPNIPATNGVIHALDSIIEPQKN